MGSLRRLRAVSLAASLVAALPAQSRAPFTGRLLDDTGAPIANAQVTCVFEPDFTSLGAPDRITARTDADGRFALQLVVGNAYVVWAVGPADLHGDCAVVAPDHVAASGKQLDLVATGRRGPTQLQVRGTSPWMKQGPLALRLLISGGSAHGPNLPLPGDGPVRLPALPTPQPSVQVIDGLGVVIDSPRLDLDELPELTSPPPQEVPVQNTDANGRPLAGVQVLACTAACPTLA